MQPVKEKRKNRREQIMRKSEIKSTEKDRETQWRSQSEARRNCWTCTHTHAHTHTHTHFQEKGAKETKLLWKREGGRGGRKE